MPRYYDGDWALYSHDPKLGRTVWVLENGDGTTTFRTDYRVDPTIDENTAIRNMTENNWKGDWHRIASVPLNVAHAELVEAVNQDDQRYLSKWLNDSDRAAWRTKGGRV